MSKPFLRWAGSKKKVIPKLSLYWDDHFSRYFEPFMGSAQFFFNINPKDAILSDINEELISTFLIVQNHPLKLYNSLKQLPTADKDFYYTIRNKSTQTLNDLEKATRFIYLNSYCFNGLYRTNEKGNFNVPFSASSGTLPSKEIIVNCAKGLKNVKILHGDFEKILRQNARKGDFIYLDPPYAVENRRIFKQYGPQTFGLSDLERLNSLLFDLDKKGCKFLLSYAYNKQALLYLNSWKHKKFFVQRNIAGFAHKRRKAAELLISNLL